MTDLLLLRLIIPQSLKFSLPNLLGSTSMPIFPRIHTLLKSLKKYIASGIASLKRCRPFVPLETLICAYNSIIEPHYDYCDIMWNNCGETNATRLQKLQNRAARILTYSDYDAEVEPLFQQLNWTQLARRRNLHTVNMVYKFTHGLAAEYLQDRFVNRVSNYFVRDSSNKFDVPLPAPIILKIVFVIAGWSYGTVCLRLLGKQNPYNFLNLAAKNSSNSIHSASMESRLT